MLVFTTLSGRLGVSPPVTALREVSMCSKSRYWVAAVIAVRSSRFAEL